MFHKKSATAQRIQGKLEALIYKFKTDTKHTQQWRPETWIYYLLGVYRCSKDSFTTNQIKKQLKIKHQNVGH